MVVFEVVSGLKENWRKSRIFPIKEVTNIQSLASLLGCEVGKVPTVHLGMPLSRKVTLINSVLDSLPTYAMSPFPIPANVVKKLNRLRRNCVERFCDEEPFGVAQWFGLGTSMLEVSSSKPLASESKGFAFWVELVTPGLPSAETSLWKEVIVHKFGQNSPWCSNEVNCNYGMVRSKLQENSRIRVGNDYCVGMLVSRGWDLNFRRHLNYWEVERVADLLKEEGTSGGTTMEPDRLRWRHS
ncbi:hypothetical protein H5410_036811 [Solanum commersonii]|uniref:Uncharacterized protein n=1 Tax=Solanum commersonii TaxID=4109 RepID=A0A9J5Y4J6_SOLCO|nr:hypothetical protein H5410_036811 [Solanum commersonii]